MQSQLIFNAKETHLFNLVEHPEWIKLTGELHEVYLTTLKDFNHQLIAQNYFVRNDLRKNANQLMSQQSTASASAGLNNGAPTNSNRRSEFMATYISRVKNLFLSQQGIMSENVKQLSKLKEENARLQSEVDKMRKEKGAVRDAQTVINEMVNQYFQAGHDCDIKSERVKDAEDFLKSPTIA